MGRSRREYTDLVGAGNFATNGEDWVTANQPDMTPQPVSPGSPFSFDTSWTTIDYNITLGNGPTAQSFSQITIWADGVISFGAPTDAQIDFMNDFEGSSVIRDFPGPYISAGYTEDFADQLPFDGYGVEVAQGMVDFSPGTDGSPVEQVLRITWGFPQSGGFVGADKQVILTATDFTIGNTNYENEGAGFSFGFVKMDGGDQILPAAISLVGDYFATVRSDLVGDGRSDFLIENTAGAVVTGEVQGPTNPSFPSTLASFSQVAGLGPEWTFHGEADFLGDGKSDFLIQNSAGAVVVGEIVDGQAVFTQVAPLGPEWRFGPSGDFLGSGHAEILIENTAGVVATGDVIQDVAAFTPVGTVAADWRLATAGHYLGGEMDELIAERSNGVVALGQVVGESLQLTPVTSLGPEWTIAGSGDVLADGKDQFVIVNTAGAVDAGEINGTSVIFTQIGDLQPGWSIFGVGDYLGEGHDQLLLESAAGAIDVAASQAGQLLLTRVAGLGLEWAFH